MNQQNKLAERILSTALALLLPGAALAQSKTAADYAAQVNPLIGSEGKGSNAQERYLEAGHTFPGAMYPFGMVQFTPTFFNPEKGFIVN